MELKKGQRLLFFITITITILYILWRIFFTLPFRYGMIAAAIGILLLLAEVLGFMEAANICFSGVWKRKKEIKKGELLEKDYPDIDIFIATYNEPASLLRKTIWGCKNMKYPQKTKLHIYICDDGSREEMEALAKEMKVGYLDRKEHTGAKAGNYNHALSCTSSPLIATFDADMIPMSEFLMELVPYFFGEGKKVGFVQSPQSFYNADLFQFNLYAEDNVPNEQNFFFRQVQLTRNQNNSVIYAGSNTILSREALQEAGGFYTESITEDLATGMLIQSKGYQTYAVGKVLANGLAPTELTSLYKQRERWARGCIQTMKRLSFLQMKGLNLGQKLDYLFSVLYWYTPIRRFIFIISPILASVFSIQIVDCTIWGILFIWIPQMIFYTILLSSITGKIRTARLSNVYDTILFPILLPAVLLESFGISEETFSVTNKDKNKKQNKENKKIARKCKIIFGGLLFFSWIGMIFCFLELLKGNILEYSLILMWLVLNSYYLVMALLFVRERYSKRESERLPIETEIKIEFEQEERSFQSYDLSEGGASFLTEFPYYIPEQIKVSVWDEEKRYYYHTDARLIMIQSKMRAWRYRIQFLGEETIFSLYRILYDRAAPFPEQVSKRSGYYKDIWNTIEKRKRKFQASAQKLPNIELNVEILLQNQIRGILKNFNYKFIEVERKEKIEEGQIEIRIGNNKIIGKREEENIYKVTNYKELIYSREFWIILKTWIETTEKRHL